MSTTTTSPKTWPTDPDAWVDSGEVGTRWGLDRQKALDILTEGSVPRLEINARVIRFRVSEILNFEAKHTIVPNTTAVADQAEARTRRNFRTA